MIEDAIKDKIIAITSYCDTSEKVNVLIQNIKLIREKYSDFKIAVHANYPLSDEIQKMVDMYFYQDLNFIGNDKWIYYWSVITNSKTNQPYFKKKFFYSILDTGFSVFQQIKALTKYLIEYKWIMLINYDASVEEIRIEDYKTDNLTLHYFPGHKAFSLIIMSFNPQNFYDKVAKYFTYENWMNPKRTDQLNEERFYDMINESGIYYIAHDYKISDKISNEPDFLKPNAPINDYFKSYLLYFADGILEVYLWDLLIEIKHIMVIINSEMFVLTNQNHTGGFEHMMKYDGEQINNITIVEINDIDVDIELKTKKGYITRSI